MKENKTGSRLEYMVTEGDGCVFLRDVFKRRLPISRALLQKLKYQERITVNGAVARTNYRLRPGDRVEADVNLEEESPLTPVDLPLDVIYEDADFLVVNKPPGLKTHPNHDQEEITLAQAVVGYFARQGLKCRFRPAARLDKDTSGLLLVAKSQYAHQAIAWQRRQGLVMRRYEAIVEGCPVRDSDRIDLPIAHLEPETSARRSVDASGRTATTHLTVEHRWERHSRLSLRLETGRTHQIRVHLSHYGHPVCGDLLYGAPSPLISRQALHAAELSFLQPRSGQRVRCISPLPHDIQKLIEALERQPVDLIQISTSAQSPR